MRQNKRYTSSHIHEPTKTKMKGALSLCSTLERRGTYYLSYSISSSIYGPCVYARPLATTSHTRKLVENENVEYLQINTERCV